MSNRKQLKRGRIKVERLNGIPYLKIVTYLDGEETVDLFNFDEINNFINWYYKTNAHQNIK